MSSPIVTEKPKYGASSDSEESDASEASNDGLENTNKIGSAVVVKGNTEYMEKGKDYSKRSRSRSNSRTKSSREDRRHKEKRQRSNGDEDEDESGSDTESKQYRRRNSYDRDDRSRRNRGRDRRDRDQRRRNEGYWSAYAPSDRYYGENRNRNWGRNKEWRDSRGWEDDGWTRDEDRKRNRNREYELDQEKSRRDKERNSRRRRERSHSEDKENSQKKSRKDREEQRDTSAAAQGKVNDGGSSDSVREKDLPSKNLAAEEPVKKPEIPKKAVDILTTKTGGAYIPPAKLKLMQKEITDKSSIAYQRLSWEALKKSIHGLINRVNTSNIAIISVKLMSENIVRGRGLLCRSLMQAQAASPTFSNVFAALISIINTRFPATVELLIKRLVVQFRRSFRRNDKTTCINTTTFLAHLINMDVVHEILALEVLTLLVENPTDHSIEVAISFLKECGPKIQEVSAAGLAAVFDSLRHILHEGQLDKRVQYMIEVMFQMRKEFGKKEIISPELDLVDENEVRTHVVTLEDAVDPQDILNVFKLDPNFVENEEKYQALKKVIVGDFSDASGSENEGSDEEDDDEEDDEEDNEKEGEGVGEIIDSTETNLVSLRRTIYLTITSSLDFEECAHKLSCLQLRPGQEPELCHMFLDCCSQQRTYEKFYGLLAQRFCQMRKVCVGAFEQIFKDSYETIHRLETNKLRNVAKFFAHLLFTDAISWDVLGIIKLDMEHTNPSSRIFVKILFQELSEYMGLQKLNERVKDPTLQTAFEGLFPRHDPKDTRFAINFFTSIGLGGLTDELRSHLKNLKPKPTIEAPILNSSSSDSSSSSTSSSSSSSSESSSDSDSSSDSSSSASSSSDDSSDSDEKSKRKSSKKKATMKKKRKLSPKKSSQKKSTSKPPKKRSTSKERMKEKLKKKR